MGRSSHKHMFKELELLLPLLFTELSNKWMVILCF